MYLRSVTIKNVKQIRELTIDFSKRSESGPRRLTVLLGRNGTGKTTILRAIGMALGGPTAANQLADASEFVSLPAQGVAEPKAQGGLVAAVSVETDLPANVSDGVKSWKIEIRPGSAFIKGDSPSAKIDDLRAQSRAGLFVAGYGVSRVLPAPMTPFSLSVPIYGQLGSLFDSLEHGRLIATNFVDMLGDTKAFVAVVQRTLKRAALLPDLKEVDLRGRGGVRSAATLVETRRFELELGGRRLKVPATWLSHGYQSTIAWVVDLLGRIVVGEHGGKVKKPDEVCGVLLIDEIDLHLHPIWQRTILKGLREAFPNLQIIATTHSPMVIADLHPDEIFLLENDPAQGVTATHPRLPPRMLTSAQLLSEYFGVQRTSAGELHTALEELRRLESQGPTIREADYVRASRSLGPNARAQALRLRKQLEDAGLDVDAWLGEQP